MLKKRLHKLAEAGKIRGCIFGENWWKSSDESWRLLQSQPGLKDDPDLGRPNPAITIGLL